MLTRDDRNEAVPCNVDRTGRSTRIPTSRVTRALPKTLGDFGAAPCAQGWKDRFAWLGAVLAQPKPKGDRGRGLTDGHKITFTCLFAHFNDKTWQCNPSATTIAKETKQDPRTVEKHLERGKKEGWIWWDRTGGGQGGSNSYRLMMARVPLADGDAPEHPAGGPDVANDHDASEHPARRPDVAAPGLVENAAEHPARGSSTSGPPAQTSGPPAGQTSNLVQHAPPTAKETTADVAEGQQGKAATDEERKTIEPTAATALPPSPPPATKPKRSEHGARALADLAARKGRPVPPPPEIKLKSDV
jgi:hypothetical protein